LNLGGQLLEGTEIDALGFFGTAVPSKVHWFVVELA